MRQENCELEVSLGNILRPAKKGGEGTEDFKNRS